LPAEPRWRLTLVGEGPLADALRQQAAALAFADRVRFAGALPPPHVREALSRADLAVCPSRREGFSVTTLEAMAAALPVVGTRVGALPTLINDEATGVLVPPEDAAALRAAIARLLADADLRRRMGAAAREVVAARYNVVAVNRPLAALVHRLAPRA
jgi:glycosyltransferase involved in cell wall biosynthesis